MRRICAFLCLSLFVSLIHAVSMSAPYESLGGTHIQHECHTQLDTKIDKSQSTNHQTHHQCCLGVVAYLSSAQYIQPEFLNYYASPVSRLILEAIPTNIFKPPRLIS